VGKSVWAIFVIGILTTLFLVMGMLMTLTQFEGTPGWMLTKLGNSIKSQFDFISAGTEQAYDGRRTTLKIQYQSKPGRLAFNQELAREEMKKVAEFAIQKTDSRERINIDDIAVRRIEVHGRGCFQNTYSAEFSMPNPLQKADPLLEVPVPSPK
jgi:hypothetical protein